MNKHNLFTSSFKTGFFFLKLFCIFAILLIFFGKIIMPQYLYGYNASLLDKMERLQSIDEPKIILIGNSNLAFGIQSQLLEEAFDMPVVNMGLQGSLGNAFHEEMIKENVNNGDIIILSHTEFNDNDTIIDPVVAWLTVENHSDLWKLIRLKDLPDMYFAYPDYAKRALNLWTSKEGNEPDYGSVYSRTAFNLYGDVSFERKTSQLDAETFFQEGTIQVPKINDTCINRLNKLNQTITSQGAVLLVAAYPIAYGDVTPPASEYVQFQENLAQALDCPVISDYTDYFYDYRYFYDTTYHLTDEGAALRTNQLILDLQTWLENNNFPSS